MRALRDCLFKKFEVAKTREMDLVAHNSDNVILFEVKTGSSLLSMYTAVGQLVVNGIGLQRHLGARKLRRVMVVPEGKHSSLVASELRKFGIETTTYTLSGNQVSFVDLPEVLRRMKS